MKESRFIELLNLYVDHQLSDEEAPELEAEIVRSAARRKTYQQYCRIQKACTLLFEQERAQAPASMKLAASLHDANRKIVAFPESRPRTRKGYYPVGLLAAAACVTFILRFSSPESFQAPSSVGAPVAVVPTSSTTIPAASLAAVEATPTPTPKPAPARGAFYPPFATRRAEQEAADGANAGLADHSVASDVSYAWMQEVELEPVQSLSPSRLTLQAPSASSEDRVLNSRKPVRDATEMTAFTFQR